MEAKVRRNLLSARYEVRADGLTNRVRFTRQTANRIAWQLRARGAAVKVVEHR